TRIHALLGDAQSISELGHHYGGGLYQKEVDYLIAREFARSPEDILLRRTKLGLHLTPGEQSILHEQFNNRLVA
ncbi:MAG: glycerol-3-phosphate dehydrogenase, partial [Pseudomonadota bacterium]